MGHLHPPKSRPSTRCPFRGHRRLPYWQGAAQVVIRAVLLLAVIAFPTSLPRVAQAAPTGFDQDCSGLTHDPILGALRSWQSADQAPNTSLAALVPRLSLRGTALATYDTQRDPQTQTSLEALFGVSPYGQRQTVKTTFYQEARAVVLSPHVIATVAHALTPDVVEVHVGRQTPVHTVPLHVIEKTLMAYTISDAVGVPARIAHLNEPYDLALVQVQAQPLLQPFPYATALSYGSGDPHQPIGGLRAGDCIAAIVTAPDSEASAARVDRLVLGKVLARVPVATNSMTQTKLNVNMFTTDLPVKPGDSGSPALAVQAGKPVLVGVVSATMFPTAMFTYVARLDPLLALADALREHMIPLQPGEAREGGGLLK